MYWHIDADIISVFVIAAIFVSNQRMVPGGERNIRDIRFARCLELGIGIAIIDIVSSMAMMLPTPRVLYHICMTLYFICIELVIVEWLVYVLTLLYTKGEKGGRTIAHAATLIFGVYVAFNCANPWTGWVYSLGENGEYVRGPLFETMIVLFGVYTIALITITVVRWKHIPSGYPSKVLILTPLILTVGIVVQLLVPGWLMIVPAYAMCLLLAFLFFQSRRVKETKMRADRLAYVAETDPLTGLYNRAGMSVMVKQALDNALCQQALVAIVDLDDLKTINDELGHAEGDNAIRLVASQLRNHFRAKDTIVRYGGDEFIVIITGPLPIDRARKSLKLLVSEMNLLHVGKEERRQLGVSVGAAIGTVGEDPYELLCHCADVALYYVKRNGKNSVAFYMPSMENDYDGNK